jgi:hypothetical protein
MQNYERWLFSDHIKYYRQLPTSSFNLKPKAYQQKRALAIIRMRSLLNYWRTLLFRSERTRARSLVTILYLEWGVGGVEMGTMGSTSPPLPPLKIIII